jgi:membrane protein DedA with SNARE-associated domain
MADEQKIKTSGPARTALFWAAIAFVIGYSGAGVNYYNNTFAKVVVATTYAVIAFLLVLVWRVLRQRFGSRNK